jgi:diaminopimelate epimerase
MDGCAGVLTRSHGLGNDYLVADPTQLPFGVSPERVKLLCDRHVGVGSDGLLLLDGTQSLRIVNPDGSEAEKSGNGLRIFARWLFDTQRVVSRQFTIRVPGGEAAVEVHADGSVTVNMGQPKFRDDLAWLEVDGQRLEAVALSIGNPHCVVFRDALDISELRRLGPLLERHAAFPNRTNVQLAHVLDRATVELLIWERGAGETQASGSSSCAVVAAAYRAGLVGAQVTARMPGGNLAVRIDAEGSLWQRGPVEEVARISLRADLIRRLQALP